MGRRDHGTVPDRGQERSSASVPRDPHGPEPTTFGPGLGFYALPPLFVVLGSGLLYLNVQTSEFDVLLLLYAMGPILAGLLFPFGAWTRYRLDEDGIERRTVGSRQYWPWEEIGSVRGMEREGTVSLARIETTIGRPATTLIRRIVFDPDGRTLFRISPWTKNRRQMAALIRRRSAG